MDLQYAKTQLLIQQGRYNEAEKIAGEMLHEQPENALVYNLLSEIKLQQDKFKEAEELIHTAIGMAPDNGIFYFNKARILFAQKKYTETEKALQETTELMPDFSTAFAVLASIQIERKNFDEALSSADHALSLDPSDTFALNMRSIALTKLNRPQESYSSIENALHEDPNNPYTHSNMGWNSLENGDYNQALIHFKEALKNDPNLEIAQAGMAEALKAKYLLYRWFLKYSFWIGNLASNKQWGFIVVFLIGTRILKIIARFSDTLRPYLTPIIVALFMIAFSTWVIAPFSNLLLRLNKYGKYLLTKEEKVSSNFVGVSFIVFLLALIGYIVSANDGFVILAAFGFTMMVPLSSIFLPANNKYTIPIYASFMFVVGLIGTFLVFQSGKQTNLFVFLYAGSFVLFQWIANYIVIKDQDIQ